MLDAIGNWLIELTDPKSRLRDYPETSRSKQHAADSRSAARFHQKYFSRIPFKKSTDSFISSMPFMPSSMLTQPS